MKNKTRRQRTESDWKDYYSSSEELKDLVSIHGKENFKREILSLHVTRGDCSYCEVKEQFLHNVLENDLYVNGNINGKWQKIKNHIKEARRYSD